MHIQDHENKQQVNETIYNETYLAKKKISSGSFGVVYYGIDLKTNDPIAIKVEKSEGNEEMKSVLKEATFLTILSDLKGIPKLYWAGTKGTTDVMVITLLGKDLTSYLKIFKKFSLKTVIMLGDQLLNIIESVHNRGVVHRDLKPENILMGKGENNSQTYLVDFGISKIYKDNNGVHIPYRDKKSFIGTTRYASISAHNGIEISRKDDLESLLYVLIFLAKGNLPWQNLKVSESEKTKKVGEMKLKITTEELCKDLPEEFLKFLNYVKNLSFKQNPDYNFLRSLFIKIASNNNVIMDYVWDWGSPIKLEVKNSSKKKEQVITQQKDHNNVNANVSFPKIGNIPNRIDTSLNQGVNDKNAKISTKIKSSSNLGNGLLSDNVSDLLKVPDYLNKSGAESQNSSFCSFNASYNNSVAIKYQNSFLNFDINEYNDDDIISDFKEYIDKRTMSCIMRDLEKKRMKM